MSNVAYSAIVLDEKSRQRLIDRFKSIIPEGWEILAHHMTINTGEIDPRYEKFLGLTVQLQVRYVAMDDKVMAVSATGFETNNAKPHITLAVNRANGGKPVMSNNLTDWKPIGTILVLSGEISEVKYK